MQLSTKAQLSTKSQLSTKAQLTIKRKFWRGRRASVSVEFALVTVMILLPLLAGGADFLQLVSAKSALNASLESMYAFAWNSPANATNTTQLGGILSLLDQHGASRVTFPDGKVDGTSSYAPVLSYGCSTSLGGAVSYQSSPCGSGQFQEVMVTYQVATQVHLVAPLPFGLANPYPLTASGQIQIQ